MKKQEFFEALKKRLSGVPNEELEERFGFLSEMIDDRIEEGTPEEEAVAALGSVDKVASQIVADIPLATLVKEKVRPKRKIKTWEIVLLALGSPIWLSLLVAAAVVILALCIVLWALVISLWAVFVSLAACALALIAVGIGLAFAGRGLTGLALAGAGSVCAGLSIFCFFGCLASSKGSVILVKKIGIWIKNRFVKKEEQNA